MNQKPVCYFLLPENESVVLTIKDDGSGFDSDELETDHLGIRGMRERVEMLGGQFSVQTAKGLGTEVKAVVNREIA